MVNVHMGNWVTMFEELWGILQMDMPNLINIFVEHPNVADGKGGGREGIFYAGPLDGVEHFNLLL